MSPRVLVGFACGLLGGCLVLAPPPELITEDELTCRDLDCRGGYACEYGECRTYCVDDSDCRDGYYCCGDSSGCGDTGWGAAAEFTECVRE